MATKVLTIGEKLSLIQQEIKVAKSQFNAFGKYYYRSAEDILEAIKPFEEKYNVMFKVTDTLHSIETMGESPLVYVNSVASITDNITGTTEVAQGQALIDFSAKGMQMPQRTGAASSYAKKYALGNLLLLDDTKDPDGTNEHGKGGAKAPTKPKSVPKPLKAMTPEEVSKFVKAIEDGKFAQVEKFLSKYADNGNKKAVVTALTKAKSGN